MSSSLLRVKRNTTTENYLKICKKLKKLRKFLLDKFEDKCFYHARTMNGRSRDCVYFPVKCVKSHLYSKMFINHLTTECYPSCVASTLCGVLNRYDLMRKIKNGRIAWEMETEHGRSNFDLVELDINDFPDLSEKCIEGNKGEWEILLCDDIDAYDENVDQIEYLKKTVQEHNNRCKGEKCIGGSWDASSNDENEL